MLRSAFSWKNAWRIRIVALGCIVLFVGIGSQVLVNAVAATASGSPDITTIAVSAYSQHKLMADGNWTHAGACAVSVAQFPLGTIIDLYRADGSFDRECIAEDTDSDIDVGSLRLAMPDNAAAAIQWGVRNLLARTIRVGWGKDGPPIFVTTVVSGSLFQQWKIPTVRFRIKV